MLAHLSKFPWAVVALLAPACSEGPARLHEKTVRAQLQKMVSMEGRAGFQLGVVRFRRQPNMTMYKLTAALAKNGLLSLENDQDLSAKFTGWDDFLALTQSGVERVATVALTPAGAKLGTLQPIENPDKSVTEYVNFEFGKATIEKVVSNEAFDIVGEKYRLVMATYSFELAAPLRDSWIQSGAPSDRDNRIRALLKWDAFDSEWKAQAADLGPRNGDFSSETVPTTLAKLRLTGAR